MLDQAALPWFAELNRALTDVLKDAQVRVRLRENVDRLERLGAEIAGLALRDDPALASYVPAGIVPDETQHLLTGMT